MNSKPASIPGQSWRRWGSMFFRYGFEMPFYGLLIAVPAAWLLGFLLGRNSGGLFPGLAVLWATYTLGMVFWPIASVVIASVLDREKFGRISWPGVIAAFIIPVLFIGAYYIYERRRIEQENKRTAYQVQVDARLREIVGKQVLPRLRAHMEKYPDVFVSPRISGGQYFRDWDAPEPRDPYGEVFIRIDKTFGPNNQPTKADEEKYFVPIGEIVPYDFKVTVYASGYYWKRDPDPSRCEKRLFGCPPATSPRK